MNDDNRHIDELIDDVAREITSVPMRDPDGLARRVSARMNEAGSAPRRRPRARMMALALAAAVVLAVAVFVSREMREPAAIPSVRLKPDATQGPDAAPVLLTAAPAVATAAPRAARLAATSRAVRAAAPAIPAIEPLTIRPLDVIAPIAVSALAANQQININPIVIDRIDILPME